MLGSELHPRTFATLAELESIDWFSKVGVEDTTKATVLSSWDDAIESCSSLEWENMCLEAANSYCERLVENDKASFARWNDVAELVRPIVFDLTYRKCVAVIEKNSLPKIFLDTVNWDIIHLCMEAEYADIWPPGYFASQAFWYSRGHFPCGWEGDFPKEGNIVIY